jgi:hypothetical protein
MSKILQGLNETQAHDGAFLLTESRTYKLWESAGQKIVEAQLTADQINQIFKQVEQGATAAGGNRTMLGKGKDAAGAVKKAYDDLVSKVQNSGPIKGVDAMYDKAAEKLKQATGGDQGVMQYVQKYRDFAKKHPVAQSLIYSALIAAAGISGAGVGGAAALGLFKMVDKLLQGEKFSTAVGKGATTGALAYGAGQLGQALKGQPQGTTPDAGAAADSSGLAQDMRDNPMLAMRSGYPGIDSGGGSYEEAFKQGLAKFAANPGNPSANDIMRAKDYAGKVASGMLKESVELTESQIFVVFGKIANRKINEGIMDTLKGAAGKAADWAKTKGTNLTTKVTADKLLQAWKKAGSPTDSLDVASIIQKAGVPSASIKQVYSTMKIPFAGEKGAGADTARKIDVDPSSVAPTSAPSSAPTSAPTSATSAPSSTASAPAADASQTAPTATGSLAQVQELIAKLDPETKEKVISTLKQELSVAESQVNELSTNKLAQYKTAASADAKKADSEGDYKRGDKRFSGIVRATNKQFDNDTKANSNVQAKTDDKLRAYYAQRKAEKQGVAEGWHEDSQELEDWSKEVNKRLYRAHESQRPALARQLSKLEQKNFGSSLNKGSLTEIVHAALMAIQKGQMVHYDPQSVGQMAFGSIVGDDARIIASAGVSSDELAGYRVLADKGIVDNIQQFLQLRRAVYNKEWPQEYLDEFAGRPGALWLQFVEDLGWSKGGNQLKEFAADDGEGGGGEEDTLRKYAKLWYNGDLGTQQQVEKILERMGWEIGEIESEEGGAFVVEPGDENGDSYIGFTAADLTDEVDEAYNSYHANRTGFSRGQRDDERHDLDKPTQVWGLKINGKVWSKGGKDVTFTSKEAALNARNSILKNKPELEIGLITKGGVAEELSMKHQRDHKTQRHADTSNSLAKRSYGVAEVPNVTKSADGHPTVKYRGDSTLKAGQTRVEPTITKTSVKRKDSDRPIPDFLKKDVEEGRYDSDDYYNPRMSRDYGARNLHTDSGAYEFEKNVPAGEPGGSRGAPKSLKGISKALPADAFGRTTGKIPAGKPGKVHSMMSNPDEVDEEKQRLDPKCWTGYKKQGTKMKGDTRVNNCVPVKESAILKGLKL